MIKRIIACFLAAVSVLAVFAACGSKPVESKRAGEVSLDSDEYDGYYSQLIYEVKDANGVISEQMYYLYENEGDKTAVGKKNLYFDTETGEMCRYTVALGRDYCEKIIDYARGYTSTDYSELYYSEDGSLTRAFWENTATNEDGEFFLDTGEQTFYPDGTTVKTFWQDRYKNDVKYESVKMEYDEEGNVTSEVIE